MQTAALKNIKDYILKWNSYFQNGYDNVYTTETGIVVSEGRNIKVIFPSDSDGAYFYLRQVKNGVFDNGVPYKIANSIRGIGMQGQIVLVAYMKGADGDLLIQNLLNTIQSYQNTSIKFLSYKINPYFVIQDELSGIEKSNIETAMRNFNNNDALVSFTFSLTTPVIFFEPNCIKAPCIEC